MSPALGAASCRMAPRTTPPYLSDIVVDSKQLADGYSQRDCNLFHVVERNVAFQSFYVGNESSIQARLKGKRILRPTVLCT